MLASASSRWNLVISDWEVWDSVEGLYRCDRRCRGRSSKYILGEEGLESEKNMENVENTKNNENVNDAEEQPKKVQGARTGASPVQSLTPPWHLTPAQ